MKTFGIIFAVLIIAAALVMARWGERIDPPQDPRN